MNTTKKIVIIFALLILQQNIQADPALNSIANKLERALTGPSNNDRRVVALTAIGAGVVITGLCLTIIGGYRAANGKPQKEGSENEPIVTNVVTDGIARLSGFGTALLGILCTVGGSATIVLAKEAIFRLQSLMDQHRIDC